MNLRIHTSKSVKETIHYHTGKKSQEEYYSTDGQEFAGCWGGKGAELLGLKGCVTDEAFARLCSNLHPLTGEQLTARMRGDRRPGFDCNFNVPKSVSLLYAYTKDERIIQALRQAQYDTMLEMQERAATRVRAGGVKDGDRITGNLVWAEIIHLTARPVDGIPDPHLHSHCYVFNVTWDGVEKRWKALQMGLIKEDADYYDRAVTMRLKANLQSLGLEIVATKDAFEIAGISRELIEKFSRRTKTIEETAQRLGITDPVQKANLAALTRERKDKKLLMSDLEPFWWGNLLPDERKALEANKTLLQRSRAVELSRQMVGEPAGETSKALGTREALAKSPELAGSSDALGTWKEVKAAGVENRVSLNQRTKPVESREQTVTVTDHDRRAVALAIKHLFERASTVTERQLIAESSRNWCIAKTTLEGIKQAVAEAPLLRQVLNGRVMVTTAEVLAEEQRVAKACRDGLLQKEPLNEYWKIEDKTLNEQQRKAVLHVLNSRDLVTGISGKAGTGKTTLLHEARRGIESGMNKLMVFAPTSEAARDVLRGEGFKNADTVARLLASEALQEEARGAVLWVDEAGLLSIPQMDRLLKVTKQLGARLVLAGDTGQHHSVERGQAFDLLEKEGRMKVAQVVKIMRQDGVYKQIVEYSAAQDNVRAIELMEEHHDVIETDFEKMAGLAAQRYMTALKHGETVMVVSPTHKECDRVTMAIREELRRQNKIGQGIEWPVLKDLSWTDAKKSDAEHYRIGMVVQVNGHLNGFALGEQLEVVSVSDEGVRVRSKANSFTPRIKALPLADADRFNVYQRETIEICEGERLRITCNGRTKDGHRLSTGNWFTVDHIAPDGRLVLKNGWRLDPSFKHLDYGYTPTSHAAQGKTVDRVILVQSADSSCAADANQFYVSISRGRRGVLVITDDIELLKEDVSVVRHRTMATELMRGESERAEVEMAAKSSDLLGAQKENTAIEMPAAETTPFPDIFKRYGTGHGIDISGKLGAAEMDQLSAESEAELEKIMGEEKELEQEMAMEM